MESAKTVIIGMGNPLLTDDGVGVAVARELGETLLDRDDIDVIELYHGGMRLMEAMVGYRRAYVVDAMLTGTVPPGTVREFDPAEFVTTKNTFSTHDTDFQTAVEMGKLLGLRLPDEVRIWGVEAAEVETFSETLTCAVAEAVPRVIDHILQDFAYAEGGEA